MTSTSDAGNFAFSFAAAGISPVCDQGDDLPLQASSPIPGRSVALPARASSSTDTGLLAITRAASR